MHSGMYRQPWDTNGGARTSEPHYVDSKKWVGNRELFVNLRNGDEKSRTWEEDSSLMFLGCVEVSLKIKFII